MRNRVVLIAIVGFIAFVLGTRSNRPVIKGRKTESARAQAERLWKDPKARKQREKLKKQAVKAIKKRTR
jgi:hypothetical protein